MKTQHLKALTVLLFLISALLPGSSQDFSKSLLWKISGQDINGASYLYGTIHEIPNDKFEFPESLKNTLLECDQLVMEIDMSNPNMMMELQNEMIMKHQRIDSLLSKEDFQRVATFFKDSMSIPLMMLNRVKPIFLSSIILQKFVGPNPASYEKSFTEFAKEHQKKISGLETIKEQISYIDQISLADQTKMLLEGVNDYEKQKREYFQLVDSYKTGNLDQIYKYMIESSAEYKEFGTILIESRNKKWVEVIPQLTKNTHCFIAVGCGHLGGKTGVLQLLIDKGYKVEPVIYK